MNRFDTLRQELAQMTPEEFAEWREGYYLGIMVCPFGEAYEFGTFGPIVYPVAPYGMSVHGVPKLHPDDE